MTAPYNPKSYNVIQLLQNEDQGQLEKIARFYAANGNLLQEYKAFPAAAINDACLSRTFNYDASDQLIGSVATTAKWTQTMQDASTSDISDILLSSITGVPGDPDGTKIADITAIGGVIPIVFTLQSDPGNDFRIDNDTELVWNGTAPTGSFPITIRATDGIGQIKDVNFTIRSFAFVNATSVSFNGTDENVDMGTAASVQFSKTDSFSFSCWLYRDTGAGTDYIYSTNTGGNNGQGIGIWTDGSERINFGLNGGTAGNRINARTPTASYVVDTWFHLVCTYDGTELISGVHIYIDGVDQTLTTVQDALTGDFQVTNDSKIGSRSDNASYWSGNIDEFAIFNDEKTSAEVTTLYNAGTPGDLAGFADIIHWYRMGDNDTFGILIDNIDALNAFMINMAPSNFDTVIVP